MIDKFSHRLDGLQATPESLMTSRSTSDQLVFPKSLAGAFPAQAGSHSKGDDLHHVAALDAVGTALASLRRRAWRSARSSNVAPGMISLFGRADSQSRMDLIASLAGRAKDFVNRWLAGTSGLNTAGSRPRS